MIWTEPEKHRKIDVDTPQVTIKWRRDEPPYIEIYSHDTLLVAGWVYPDGPHGQVMMTATEIPPKSKRVHVFSDDVEGNHDDA